MSNYGWNERNSLSYDPDLGQIGPGFDPVALVRATRRISLNSQRFIEYFTAADTAPITVDPNDPTSVAARNAQIVQITRRIAAEQTLGATDKQVLDFWRTALMGWF